MPKNRRFMIIQDSVVRESRNMKALGQSSTLPSLSMSTENWVQLYWVNTQLMTLNVFWAITITDRGIVRLILLNQCLKNAIAMQYRIIWQDTLITRRFLGICLSMTIFRWKLRDRHMFFHTAKAPVWGFLFINFALRE